MNLTFTVYGKPEPQGSSRAFIPKGWKRAVITSANAKLKSFRQEVSVTALAVMRKAGLEPIPAKVPVSLVARFYFQRPKSKSGKASMTVRPDADKCARSLGDSLSGICFHDDSQVTVLHVEKHYGNPERTEIEVKRLPDVKEV